jgi:hypothetical protein
MRFVGFGRYALSVSLATVMLAGCGVLPLNLSKGQDDMQPPIGVPGAVPQRHMRNVVPQWQARQLAHPACPQVVGKPACLALISNKNGISPFPAAIRRQLAAGRLRNSSRPTILPVR